jgi:hypothetical protein
VADCDDEPLEPVSTVEALVAGPLGIMAVVALSPSEPEMSRWTAVQRSAALPAPGLVPATSPGLTAGARTGRRSSTFRPSPVKRAGASSAAWPLT